ncbi:longevity assurance proteins LAG1/LAC1 [Multifurca ochricompacta]|uniref:Longevity assurance proteins LAG1/LAC1 n=1 Tax=Multifurca ochricompacta TaxID=376703 RepID=A0AAD4MBP2_9AGAM|nr:longevity assurance proteins LAG1/LAC1 [Multifurca ochricompacta]
MSLKSNKPQSTISMIETDPSHHLTGPLMPQTPLDSYIPHGSRYPIIRMTPVSHGLWSDLRTGRWVVVPSTSLRMVLLPLVLHIIWIVFAPLFFTHPPPSPFAPLFFISHPTPSPTDDITDPRYRKGWFDLVFLAYYVVVFSFVRQFFLFKVCYPIAHHFGIRKEGKLARFGEQGYAIIYFSFFGAWGVRIMSHLPTWWYNCQQFWIDYPHWQMTPELKRYYLMQASYWCQQLVVLVFGLEKPRKDYRELVAHHVVTLWLIGLAFGLLSRLFSNLICGHHRSQVELWDKLDANWECCVTSMDIPDVFLATVKVLTYLRWERAQIPSFILFIVVWTYFRHYLNLVMLWSVYKDFDLIPHSARSFSPSNGVWMAGWMKWQIFTPILLLQCLNLFWYFLIWRILWHVVMGSRLKDDRSDDEGSDDEASDKKKKKRS